MSKRQLIMLLGLVIIAVALFSGLPSSWNDAAYVVLGLIVIVVAYLMKPVEENDEARMKKESAKPYVDARVAPAVPPVIHQPPAVEKDLPAAPTTQI